MSWWNLVRIGIAAVTIVAVAELSSRFPRWLTAGVGHDWFVYEVGPVEMNQSPPASARLVS